MENVIEIDHLFKSFKDVQAVNDLSFKVRKGEFFSFLGINGAGKSTTISIICGFLTKDSGSIFINNKNIDEKLEEIKPELGVVYQTSALDKALTVKDNLRNRAVLYGIYKDEFEKRYEELSKAFCFEDLANRVFGKLSGGQKRRVDIARALIHNPSVLILDEPTTGLDPQTRQLVWENLNKLRKEKNITIILTTHYMEEVADSDYVVILDNGSIKAEGTPIELKNKYSNDYIVLYNTSEENVKKLNLPYKVYKDHFKLELVNTKSATDLIINNPDIFVDFEIIKGRMDDVFLNVTGKRLGGNEK